VKVVEARRLQAILLGHLFVTDGTLGWNFRQKTITLRVTFAGG
jgi:hypothetical protein